MLKEKIKLKGVLATKTYEYERPTKFEGQKAIKRYKKDTLKVTLYDVEFDADETSLIYLSSVVALANQKFNALLAQGTTAEDAYAQIYEQTVSWKGADNKIHSVKVSTLAKVLEEALGTIANIIGV